MHTTAHTPILRSGLFNVSLNDVVIIEEETESELGKDNVQASSDTDSLLEGDPVSGESLFLLSEW